MLSHIIRASLAGAAALGIASCAFGGAVSASYLGMGTSTGTPSGDVLAIINPHQRDRSPIISRDGGRVPDDGLERPEAVGQLNFQRPMRIAVHNEPGSEPDAEMINATKEFIRVMFGSQNVNIYYLNDRDLSQSIRTGGVDFFIADQSFYALEQAMGGVEQIAVMWPGTGDSPSEAMASTFFRKKPADGSAVHDPLTYVATHELAAMTPKSMSAWLVGAGELVKRRRIGYEDLLSRTTFTNNSQRDLVEYVLAGRERVGLLPACALEQLALDPSFPMDEIEVLNPKKKDGLSCVHSTEVYPGRVFAAVNDIDPTLKKAMTAVLLGMSSIKYGAEWALPVTNRPVFDLFYTLKIGPYSDLAGWSFQRFVREHAEIIALIMLVIFLVLTYTTTLSILVRRRTRALRDALGQRDRIEAEAAQSRQHIANLERTGIVGQMSTIIAHELKQPLGAITNYGNGLLRRLGRGDVEREKLELALREIVLQAERASKIVERVRSYAKHDYPPRKVSDLSIIIENAIQTFRRSRTTDAELTVRMHPHSMAEVDGWEIELVVLNLLKNAADAISGIPDPKIEVCLYPSDEHTWILTVGDNGPYISDEQLSRFFKPLQTSKGEAGMGLGLSIVANIAERHAGNITVARNGSRGVKFTMTIPSKMKDVSVIADMGPETVSIYESGGNGRVAREVVERRGEEQADESPQLERSLPATVHTGTLNDAVHLMQDGDMHRTGRPRPPGIPGSKG